jgi:hypothetical protein
MKIAFQKEKIILGHKCKARRLKWMLFKNWIGKLFSQLKDQGLQRTIFGKHYPFRRSFSQQSFLRYIP